MKEKPRVSQLLLQRLGDSGADHRGGGECGEGDGPQEGSSGLVMPSLRHLWEGATWGETKEATV